MLAPVATAPTPSSPTFVARGAEALLRPVGSGSLPRPPAAAVSNAAVSAAAAPEGAPGLRDRSGRAPGRTERSGRSPQPSEGTNARGRESSAPASGTRTPQDLSPEDRRELERLKRRDREVRNHEQAHASVGGQHAGPPQYSYERGPDGRLYATEGEVSIDVSPIPGNPEATLRKMQQVRRAALAPAQPSAQDRRVAALADRRAAEARREIAERAFESLLRGEVPDAGLGISLAQRPVPTSPPLGEVARTLSALVDAPSALASNRDTSRPSPAVDVAA